MNDDETMETKYLNIENHSHSKHGQLINVAYFSLHLNMIFEIHYVATKADTKFIFYVKPFVLRLLVVLINVCK